MARARATSAHNCSAVQSWEPSLDGRDCILGAKEWFFGAKEFFLVAMDPSVGGRERFLEEKKEVDWQVGLQKVER